MLTKSLNVTSLAETALLPPPTTILPDDVIGMIVLNGEKYLQFATGEAAESYTLDECLGSAEDFEGTYKTYLKDMAAKVYTVKEYSGVLIVKLGNGGTVALRKE